MRITTGFLCFFLFGFLACLSGCGGHDGSKGGAFPTRSITVICPWNAGGGTDRVARFFADQFEKRLGKPVVVVNKTGGGGSAGHAAGAGARPDGHTITMGTFELSTMHWMGISPLTHEDFLPIMQVNADPAAIIVRADAPWDSLESFLEAIKADPGTMRMSGTAGGGAWDLARAGMLMAAGLEVGSVIWVPTDGAAPSIKELLGGHIEAVCCSLPEAAMQIEAGQLRALAAMAPERVPGFTDVPTLRESGVDWAAAGWRGLFVPKATPPAIAGKIRETAQAIAESSEYRMFMEKNGFGIELKESESFAAFLREQDGQWESVIRAGGFARNE